MNPRPSLEEQILALENVVLSNRAWLEQAKIAAAKGNERFEIPAVERQLPALDAALDTLRYLHTHRETIRAWVISQRQGPEGRIPTNPAHMSAPEMARPPPA